MKSIFSWLVCLAISLGTIYGAEAQAVTYTVGGSITGLASGKTVVLKNNTSTVLVPSTSASFIFPAQNAGTSWNVSVAIQPSGQTCTVSNPSGTNIAANVTNVAVSCINTFTVGGTVSGLSGASLVLRMGTISLVVNSGATTFKFASGLKAGASYNVLAAIQPPGFSCSVANGIGTIVSSNITNVAVTCVRTYTVGGTISGLTASGLTLKLNAVSKVVTAGSTAFTFASALKSGVSYTVIVLTQPTGQTCSVVNGAGVIVDSNITNVSVSCVTSSSSSSSATSSIASSSASSSSAASSSSSSTPATYTVSGGEVSGLGAGKCVVLQNNGANDQTVCNPPSTFFPFPAQNDGLVYNVTIKTQPVGQTCLVTNGSGTLGGANVTNVAVTCTDTTYTISGSISGLTASGLSVSLSGSKSDSVSPASGATSYAFMQTVVNGNNYTVTISAQPTGQTCTLSPNPATGTVGTTNIVVNVTCAVNTYTIALTNSSAAAVTISGSTATNATNPNSATSFNFSAKHGDAVVLLATKTGNTCSVATTPASINPITGNATATVSCTLNTYTICLANPYGATIVASGSSISNIFNAGCVSVKSGDVVTIAAAKSGYTCSVAGSPINVGSANVILSVSCIPNTYSVGGTVSGLGAGKSVVLQNNSDNNQTVTYPTSTFSFSAQNDGSGYNVTVLTQPVGQTCVVSNGIGMVAGENITNVSIICTDTTYTVSGSISGLNAGACLVLLINGKDTWSNCSGLGSFPNFSFPAQLNGSIFNVTVLTQPVGQTCVVFNGSGTIVGTNVTDVTVTCTTNTYALTVTSSGGAVTSSPAGINCGVTCTASYSYGTSVTLTATPNAGATFFGWTGCDSTSGSTCTVSVTSAKSVTASFTYPVTVSKTGTGSGTVTSTPTGISCGAICTASYSNGTSVVLTGSPAAGSTFSSWSGCDSVSGSSCTVSANAVRSVTANFTLSTYTVSGTVSGLGSGKSVVLQNNGANNQTVTYPSTGFSFPAQADGSGYNVTVLTQPVGQTCSLLNNSGTLAGSNVTNVSVTCTDTTYTISGSITGLSASGLSLSLSGSRSGTVSPVSGATSYAFTQTVVNGNTYTVSIGTQPTGQTCTLSPSPATGTVGTTNIVVDVTCTVNAYTIAVTNSSGAAVSIGGSTATNATNPNSATSFSFSAKHGDAVVLSAAKTGNTCSVVTTPVSINPITSNATAAVSCTLNTYSVGGTNADGASVAITNSSVTGQVATTANPYSFNAKYGDVVTLSATKTGYTCSVAGSPITMAAANVTTANVTCSKNTYTISGTTDGTTVTASGSTVSNTVTTNAGSYSLSAKYGDVVTLSASKTGYSGCVIAASPITVSGDTTANVGGCTLNTYMITVTNTPAASVSISGSTATNATNPNSATSFSFSAKHGDNVTLSATKTGNTCSVTPSTISAIAASTSATVSCSTNTYTVSGTVSGLGSGKSVVLQNNGANNQTVTNPATGFSFPAQNYNSTYNVTVFTQPLGQTCLLFNNSGTGSVTGNVTSVSVTCTTDTYSIGGTVTGLGSSNQVVIDIYGVNPITITNNNSFGWTGASTGLQYAVAVRTQPTGQTCIVTNGSGTVAYANVTNIQVTCEVGYSVASGDRLQVSDPLAIQQWHLLNTGQSAYAYYSGIAGNDINVDPVYKTYGYTGKGVTVAVVDSGLEIAHKDLAANVIPNGSWNFANNTTDPTSSATDGDHGTSVAGLIAMARNKIGGIGVASSASLKGFKYGLLYPYCTYCEPSSLGLSSSSPNSSDVAIFNQSYGVPIPHSPQSADYDMEATYKNGVENLRNTKGAIYITSGGNDFENRQSDPSGTCLYANNATLSCYSTNFDPLKVNPYRIVVGAVNANGVKSSYSTAGSSLWVSAPGGEYGSSSLGYPAMITTDQSGCSNGFSPWTTSSNFNLPYSYGYENVNPNCDYTNTMNGTSSAAPVVSGVVALMLEANPLLTWREVKDILAKTSKQVDAFNSGVYLSLSDSYLYGNFSALQPWITNAANYRFHNYYGFGLVDAKAAVDMARTYTSGQLGVFNSTGNIISSLLNYPIPDNSRYGAAHSLYVNNSGVGTVEAVQIFVTASGADVGDLAIELTSPSGTRSVIKTGRDAFRYQTSLNMKFLSNAFYGESATGYWTIRVLDTLPGYTNTLVGWKINVYGH